MGYHDGLLIGTFLGLLCGFAGGKMMSSALEALRRYRDERLADEHRRHALAQARAALAEIARCPHDKDHVKRTAAEGIRDSAVCS